MGCLWRFGRDGDEEEIWGIEEVNSNNECCRKRDQMDRLKEMVDKHIQGTDLRINRGELSSNKRSTDIYMVIKALLLHQKKIK